MNRVSLSRFAYFSLALCHLLGLTQPTVVASDIESETKSRDLLHMRAAFRGPVDICVATDESWAVTINELSHSVSLVDLVSGKVLDEVAVGEKPAGLAKIGHEEFLVACRYSGAIHRLRVAKQRLVAVATIHVGLDPLGIATDGQSAFVGLQATGEVAVINLLSNVVERKFPVGRWPRYLACSADGSRLAVGLSGDSEIGVFECKTGEELYREPLSSGINIGQLQIAADGKHVYFPWMVYRANPITVRNIQKGWVLASRIARIRMDGPQYREAISLDVPRLAVADPHGLVLTPNEHRMAVTSAGTHELLVYRQADLPLVGAGGPGDLIDPKLTADPDLFYRIELGGRPLGLVAGRDNERVYVANNLLDAIQVVNLESRKVEQSIRLGQTPQDEEQLQIQLGRSIFHDAEYSLDQWYSCHSCHLDGGTNAKPMDTWNDGTELTHKTVTQLYNVTQTAPWTWHGWQQSLEDSVQNSFVSTMKGDPVSQLELDALMAYLAALDTPPNPFAEGDGGLSVAARRGKKVFERSDVGCVDCHSGPHFTDGEIYDVGLTRETDYYEGYNTPSLAGVYRKPRLLHDGRARDLKTVLRKWHRPEEIGGGASLSEDELSDLIEYLKTL